MRHITYSLSLALALAALPAASAPGAPQVVCISGTMEKSGCKGVAQRLDHAQFLKRWPADHAISITTHHILPTHAKISVTGGTLTVVKVVRNGKEIGTKPVYVIQMSRDTDNLSDGAPEDIAAENIGWSLANALNRAIASGSTDDR